MIYYCAEPDILNLKDNTIIPVIPVNCKGVMGAGLAKQFKDKYPDLFEYYAYGCRSGELSVGRCALVENDTMCAILFPTKDDWHNDSTLDYISSGLDDLVKCLTKFSDFQIAIPPLGCGLGHLTVQQVLPLIYNKLKDCKNNIFLVGF